MPDDLHRRLAVIAGLALGLALVLRLALGARWHSFYGAATAVLVALPFLATALSRDAVGRGLSRWPIWLAVALSALPALIQIGFWATFFTLGADGATLAIGRSLVLGKAGFLLPWLAAALAGLWLWLLARRSGPNPPR
ncbi:MAG: hypothetical protein AB1749_09480 [Pseudomonadota bacterium]